MREIKFREWDSEREQNYGKGYGMSYSERIEYDDSTSFRFLHEEDLTYKNREEVNGKFYRRLMQYTGMKDITGKEIYEGDIVSNELGYKHIIKFDRGSFSVGDYYFGSIGAGKELKVIGNIYENPELI